MSHEPIHEMFGLCYSNFLVLHRTLLQSMPVDWQERFVGCIRELEDAFRHVEQPDGFKVETGEWKYLNECTSDERDAAGVTISLNDAAEAEWMDDRCIPLRPDLDKVFVRRLDPIPNYDRGRARIETIAPVAK